MGLSNSKRASLRCFHPTASTQHYLRRTPFSVRSNNQTLTNRLYLHHTPPATQPSQAIGWQSVKLGSEMGSTITTTTLPVGSAEVERLFCKSIEFRCGWKIETRRAQRQRRRSSRRQPQTWVRIDR